MFRGGNCAGGLPHVQGWTKLLPRLLPVDMFCLKKYINDIFYLIFKYEITIMTYECKFFLRKGILGPRSPHNYYYTRII